MERNAALEALRSSGRKVLLMAVSGGPFAEGVDYPGAMLEGVVVISPALPQVRFEQERMRLYFEERYGKGFEYAFVIPGMTRVVQSAGRVIRSETDVGVIVLVCRRFLQNPYRRYLPRDWYEESPDELAREDPAAATEEFFRTASQRRRLPSGARRGQADGAEGSPGSFDGPREAVSAPVRPSRRRSARGRRPA